MPVYEFLCRACNKIFSFHSFKVAPEKTPVCPKCGAGIFPGSGVRRVGKFQFAGRVDSFRIGSESRHDITRRLLNGDALQKCCRFLNPLRQELRRMNAEKEREQKSQSNGQDHEKVVMKFLAGLIRRRGPERIRAMCCPFRKRQ